jgi:hypothetical protein
MRPITVILPHVIGQFTELVAPHAEHRQDYLRTAPGHRRGYDDGPLRQQGAVENQTKRC